MKKIMSVGFFLVQYLHLTAQDLNYDQIFIRFEECIEKYVESNYIQDSNFLCYYDSEFNYKMTKDDNDDGGFYYPNVSYILDSSVYKKEGKKPFFYRKQSYTQFLNMILPQLKVTKSKLPLLNGTVVFVHCPEDYWNQFYCDTFLFDDIYYLVVSLDILKSTSKEKYYKREMVICKYSKKNGFVIDKTVEVSKRDG